MTFVFRRLVQALFLLFLLSVSAYAAEVDGVRARLVAENYLQYVVTTFNRWEGKQPLIESVTPVNYQGTAVFWLVDLDPSGFMLVSSRDELSPVKVYAEKGVFDPAQVDNSRAPESWIIPEQHAAVKALTSDARRSSTATSDPAVDQAAEAWVVFGGEATTQDRIRTAVRAAEVSPIIQASWGQADDPNDPLDTPLYNAQCPLIGLDRTLVGCVSTAWSMLMRHWQWPDRGVGSKTHYWNGQLLTVNFAEETWDWSVMPDSLTVSSSTAARDAVAKLCYQVGVAAEMDWGVSSSGSILYANNVLDVYFKYKTSMSKIDKSVTDSIAWFNYFKTEFDAVPPRPVVMSIFLASNGGHEILADGYQEGITDKVHLNMGWDGYDNAWYDVTSDFVAGGYTWVANKSEIIIGIEPDYSLRDPSNVNTVPVNMLLLQ